MDNTNFPLSGQWFIGLIYCASLARFRRRAKIARKTKTQSWWHQQGVRWKNIFYRTYTHFWNTHTMGGLEYLCQCSRWMLWGTQCCFCSCQVALSSYSTFCGKNKEVNHKNWPLYWVICIIFEVEIDLFKLTWKHNRNELHVILPWCNKCIAIFIKLICQQAFRNWWRK